MRFEYWNAGDGSWTWHLKTSVNDVLARGASYGSRDNCLAAIKLVKLAAGAPVSDISAQYADRPESASAWASALAPSSS